MELHVFSKLFVTNGMCKIPDEIKGDNSIDFTSVHERVNHYSLENGRKRLIVALITI